MAKARYRHAVALSYERNGNSAPIVSAQGDDLIADEVVRIAKRYRVPVLEKPHLAKALSLVDVNQEIPQDLFEVVALVLAEIESQK